MDPIQNLGELKMAIDADDLARVQSLMSQDPELHRAPLGYGGDGPLTWVAECRIPGGPPSPDRLAIAAWMIENGSDVHQGGDGPLMRAALRSDRIPMMALLVRHGADADALWHGFYPIVLAPCETLQPASLRWLLDHGANLNVESRFGSPLAMVVGTYSRNAEGKHGCLETIASTGYALPDTAPMAINRGRIDLLERLLTQDSSLLSRRFREDEIYPPELGLKPGDGLHATPLYGSTLLHQALEFDDIEMVKWLLDHGADPNARAEMDSDGFGGHTPLFHAVVTLGRKDDAKARLLLERGADPALRTTLRKQLRDAGDPAKEQMKEFHNVTAIEYAQQFQEPHFVSAAALNLIQNGRGCKAHPGGL